MRTAVIGAGMAGMACAEVLVQAGWAVDLFDKGRGPGGRMSTRRITTAAGEASSEAATRPEARTRCMAEAFLARWGALAL